MATRRKACWVVVMLLGTVPMLASAACKAGFVPRLASAKDAVCVPAPTQFRTAAENTRAPLLWTPGPFGPKTCAMGFVWREAYVADLVCVTPEIRTETLQDNVLASTRQQ